MTGVLTSSYRPAPITRVPPEQRTLPALLERQAQAQAYGDKTLLRVGAIERSYREVRDVVAAVAGMLRRAGVRAGDRVPMLSGNRLELLDVILGCAWMGAVAVPLNVAVRGEALRHALTNSGAKILVIDPGSARRVGPDQDAGHPGGGVAAARRHDGDRAATSLRRADAARSE
jgi:crotonobetaine/carnitine-CoA ligase